MKDNLLLTALVALNKKLEENNAEFLHLKVCGGFAMFRYTGEMTHDIDSVNVLSSEIKNLVYQVSEEIMDIDYDWLNDDWNIFGSKTYDAITVDRHIQWEEKPEIVMSKLDVTFAKIESLLCMKYFAIVERSKPKDLLDFQKMMKINNVTLPKFLSMLKQHGVTEENEDVVMNLYVNKIISDEECTNYFLNH